MNYVNTSPEERYGFKSIYLIVYGLHEWQRARKIGKITRTLRKYTFLYSTLC